MVRDGQVERRWGCVCLVSADSGGVVLRVRNRVCATHRNANGCANNCTSTTAGTCNAATSTCACTSDFQSFDCSQAKNQLERWEWALIMGGGVLVAIGLIGCIVYFIQKQQVRLCFCCLFVCLFVSRSLTLTILQNKTKNACTATKGLRTCLNKATTLAYSCIAKIHQ